MNPQEPNLLIVRARLPNRLCTQQAAGNADEADRLLSEAQKLDPEAVAVVLNAHDAAETRPGRAGHAHGKSDAEPDRWVEPGVHPLQLHPGAGSEIEILSVSKHDRSTGVNPALAHPLVESDQIQWHGRLRHGRGK